MAPLSNIGSMPARSEAEGQRRALAGARRGGNRVDRHRTLPRIWHCRRGTVGSTDSIPHGAPWPTKSTRPHQRARADRAPVRQGLDHEDGRVRREDGVRRHLDRLDRARPRAGRRRASARPHRRDLRSGVERQDDARAARHRRGAEARRHGGVRRRRARARSDLCAGAGDRPRQPAGLAARHRRTGARHRRDARALERRRRRRASTRSPRSSPRPSSKATWAIPTSACRRG